MGKTQVKTFAAILWLAIASPEYHGRYEQSDGNIVRVYQREGTLIVRPLFWRATQELVADGPDVFHAAERPERKATFERDAAGRVVSLTMNGIGHDAPMPRLMHDRPVPAELLMSGKPREAAKLVLARKDAVDVAVAWGDFLVRALPTKWVDGAAFIGEIVKAHPESARLRVTHGALLVAAGRTAEAKKAYARALQLDSKSERAATALRMLSGDDLGALFAKPARQELDTVLARWAKRDLAPRDVEIVHRGSMELGHTSAEVRIVAHRVHGSLHYGAVIVPSGAKNAPVIVEAKGVSPSYFPLDLSRVPAGAALLQAEQKDFLYFLPSYRGEVLQLDGKTWTSEGDRTDVWDGATDDFLAFTAAALTVTPEADGAHMCAFGRSRGGSVAMLAGIRDRRFDCVVSWAGPTDHLFEMMNSGWTPRQRAAEAVRSRVDVFGIGGQFRETFLMKERSVAETRLHVLASSPLWFADCLPVAQLHYGEDDSIVEVRNGRAAAKRNPRLELVVHREAGHDLDKPLAWRETRRFLLQHLMAR